MAACGEPTLRWWRNSRLLLHLVLYADRQA